jgi:cytochrome bd-type quinol oxidase subunit 2
MISSLQSRAANIARAAAPLILISVAASILLLFPPTRYSFYPQCPIYSSFHLLCPGCGTTRAIAALLRGHLREALHLNTLTTLMLPFAAAYAIQIYPRYLSGKPIHWAQPSRITIYTVLCITLIFTIARNL